MPETIAALIPDSQLVIFEKSRHSPPSESASYSGAPSATSSLGWLPRRIRAAAAGGVAAFIDTHGGGYLELALALGVTAERIDTIADFAAAAKHGVKTDGGREAGPAVKVLTELAGLIADGQLEVPIANVYPLAQVREAYTELERRHTRGKIVLRP
jgi:NADPH:quinone reductase-like Zn-dependent oxidoreductase